MRAHRTASALVLATALAGCGSNAGPKAPPGVAQSDFERQLADAAGARAGDFPAVLVPGTNRLAFGVLSKGNAFVYGKRTFA